MEVEKRSLENPPVDVAREKIRYQLLQSQQASNEEDEVICLKYQSKSVGRNESTSLVVTQLDANCHSIEPLKTKKKQGNRIYRRSQALLRYAGMYRLFHNIWGTS